MITLVTPTEKEKSEKNRELSGWWAATLIERFEIEGVDYGQRNRRRRIFKNFVFLKAATREQAYLKAIDHGLSGNDIAFDWVNERTGQRGRWVFEGVSGLAAVFGKPGGDDAEILLDAGRDIPVKFVRPWLRKKRELAALRAEQGDDRID